MEADAELYLFDYHRYRYEVVPALVRLLRIGALTPWLSELVEAGNGGHPQPWAGALLAHLRAHPTDLVRICGYLGEDLRYADADRRENWPGDRYRPCLSTTCPQRGHCPLHQGPEPWLSDAMACLFEAAIARRCLGAAQYLGHGTRASDYFQVLGRLDVPQAEMIRNLLAALELRGSVFGRRADGGHGVHGWLDAAETREFAQRLEALPLPRHETTFTAMAARRISSDALTHYQPEDFGLLSLAFVRTVAVLASETGQGLLWGSGLAGPPRPDPSR